MGSLRLKLGLGTLCLALLSPSVRGAAAVPPPGEGDRIAALAAQVDRRLEAGYAAARVTPAAIARRARARVWPSLIGPSRARRSRPRGCGQDPAPVPVGFGHTRLSNLRS